MDRVEQFERNLLVLYSKSPELCGMLSNAETTKGHYDLLFSRNKLPVPAIKAPNIPSRPLHSLMDPNKEAVRLVSTVHNTGYLVIFGLGGAYLVKAALERKDIHSIAIIDFNFDAMAELFSLMDFVPVFSDPRVTLIINPDRESLCDFILSTYKPALHGGIQVLPVRPRIDFEPEIFKNLYSWVKDCINTVSEDYSVQAYFGKPWFANTIRNIFIAEKSMTTISVPKHVSVTAAGPSLEMQMPHLKQEREHTYILATDTSLPALLAHDIEPDAVISIDCQHISYYHFISGVPKHIPLFLDLSSPSVVALLTKNPCFFSGGHPLTRYISQYWRNFPFVDTSGGNVTYAAVALANQIGAETINLYGADYSYPEGSTYARGTYIHTLFNKGQDRLHPMESLFSAFLFRNDHLLKVIDGKLWRYETKPLINYRKKLEILSGTLQATLNVMAGNGAPIQVRTQSKIRFPNIRPVFATGEAVQSGTTFLQCYSDKIQELPELEGTLPQYLQQLNENNRDVFTTLLPLAAFIRQKNHDISVRDLIRTVKEQAVDQITSLLSPTAR